MVIELEKEIGKCQVKGCTFVRKGSNSVHWENHMIDHPIYGRVTNRQAANYDLYYHTCDDYKAAVTRATARRLTAGEELAVYRRKGYKG